MKSSKDKEQEWLDGAIVWAADGELDRVREFIAEGANVNGMPLLMAIQCDEPEIVQTLIDAGSNVNIICRDTTPLIHAIRGTHAEIVRILISSGADISQPDTSGRTPFVATTEQSRLNATQKEKDEVIEIIAKAGGTS